MEQKTIDKIALGVKIFGAVLFTVCTVLLAYSIYQQRGFFKFIKF